MNIIKIKAPAALVGLGLLLIAGTPITGKTESTWMSKWAVQEGFSISKDTDGYDNPTAIAFVPNPGNGPKDPLYFVTEIRGKIKVVTNDRTVFTFAEDFFQFTPEEELPEGKGQGGMAGICLEPSRGYVFATFIYHTDGGIIRNNIVRFQATPGTFSLKPTGQVEFTEVFAADRGDVAHQIGQCQIRDDLLYVGVGDGRQTTESQRIGSTLGKVLRMDLNGKPVPGNPFYRNSDVRNPSNYVWAYGFRNPFGLEIVDGRVFAAENGLGTDRFLELQEGENHLWNGSDSTLATNASVVFIEAVSPVQIDFMPSDSNIFPEKYGNTFFIALSGAPRIPGPGDGSMPKGVAAISFSLDKSRVTTPTEQFMEYIGNGFQSVVGTQIGPDGLYVVPLFADDPDAGGAVLKISYDPDNEHPHIVGRPTINDADLYASYLLKQKGCLGCHKLGDQGSQVGPALDKGPMNTRLNKRLNSTEFVESFKAVDELDREPFISFREARKEVLAAEGADRNLAWVKYQIQEPRFDDASSQMPNLGLSEDEAEALATYLVSGPSRVTSIKTLVKKAVKRLNPSSPRRSDLYLYFAGGLFIGGVTILFVWFLSGRFRRRRV